MAIGLFNRQKKSRASSNCAEDLVVYFLISVVVFVVEHFQQSVESISRQPCQMNGFNIYLHRTMALCCCTPGSIGDVVWPCVLLLFNCLFMLIEKLMKTQTPLSNILRADGVTLPCSLHRHIFFFFLLFCSDILQKYISSLSFFRNISRTWRGVLHLKRNNRVLFEQFFMIFLWRANKNKWEET